MRYHIQLINGQDIVLKGVKNVFEFENNRAVFEGENGVILANVPTHNLAGYEKITKKQYKGLTTRFTL